MCISLQCKDSQRQDSGGNKLSAISRAIPLDAVTWQLTLENAARTRLRVRFHSQTPSLQSFQFESHCKRKTLCPNLLLLTKGMKALEIVLAAVLSLVRVVLSRSCHIRPQSKQKSLAIGDAHAQDDEVGRNHESGPSGTNVKLLKTPFEGPPSPALPPFWFVCVLF